MTNEFEFATDADVRVEPEESGLEFPVMVHTDLVGSLYDRQLDKPLGRLVEKLGFLAVPFPNSENADSSRVGFPLEWGWDARREWKRSELGDLHRLQNEVADDVIREEEEAEARMRAE